MYICVWYGASSPHEEGDTLSYEEEDICICVYGTGQVVHLRRRIHCHIRRRIHVYMCMVRGE